jgi:hypothetical protein
MKILTKSPDDPELVAAFKAQGKVVLEVTTKRFYILHAKPDLDQLLQEWFVRYRGCSHAYRDGSLVGGADEVQQVHNLTTGEVLPWPTSSG